MEINRQTYSGFFLLYVDRELTEAQMNEVETFVQHNPDLREEFQLLQQTVVVPDDTEIFEEKSSLYRKEERRVAPMIWWRMSAAAVVLITLGLAIWLNRSQQDRTGTQHTIARITPSIKSTNHQPPARKVTMKDEGKNEVPISMAAANSKQSRNSGITALHSRSHSNSLEKIRSGKLPADNLVEREDQAKNLEEQSIPLSVPTSLKTSRTPAQKEDIRACVPAFAANTDQFIPDQELQHLEQFQNEENDRIYVANTSVSKRNRLRVVFRKASRMLEKVSAFSAMNELRKTE